MDSVDKCFGLQLYKSFLSGHQMDQRETMTILDMAMQRGIRPKWVAGTAGGEYHSECPECGGMDRFYIQPHKQMKNCKGYFCCRKCGTSGDAIQFARKF